ncbi:hypothetical protein ACJJTC_012337 [Scirpophaga incertulas]
MTVITQRLLISIILTRLPRKRNSYKKRFDPFTLNEEDFRKKYRFTKKFTRKIVDLVRSDIEKKANGGGLSAEVQVCTALRTWVRQEVQDDSADIHALSQQSITNLCRRVAMSLAQKHHNLYSCLEILQNRKKSCRGLETFVAFEM